MTRGTALGSRRGDALKQGERWGEGGRRRGPETRAERRSGGMIICTKDDRSGREGATHMGRRLADETRVAREA